MTPVFLQIGLGFSPCQAGLMMIPMVLGSMGMKLIVVQVVNRFGYRRVLVATTLGLSLVTLLLMTTALLGWYFVLPFVLFLQGMVNSTRFSSMNTLTLKDLPDNLASSGNSLLSMIMQLSMSIGVTIAGLLLGLFGSQHVSVDSGTTQTGFMYTWLSMALIIALPAFIFARVPNDTHQNVAISRRKRLSMIMQLSMSIGVTIAGLLLGLFGSQHVSVDSGTTQTGFMYTWLSMALIIALPAFIFARVPNDTHQNVAISRRKRSVDSGTTQTGFMYTWLSMALIIALPAFIFARVPNDTHQNVAISRRKRIAQ